MDFSNFSFEQGFFAGIAVTLLFFLVLFIFHPWIKSILNAAPVPFFRVLAMRLRGNPASLLVDAYINFVKQQKDIEMDLIEVCYTKNKHMVNDLGSLIDLVDSEIEG